MSSKEEILQALAANRAEIVQRFGVCSLALFGSVARGEAGPDSDVDVLVDFGGAPTWNQYMDLVEFLEDRLARRIDLVTVTGLKPRARPYVERDLIRVA